jgi:hypothetical protein
MHVNQGENTIRIIAWPFPQTELERKTFNFGYATKSEAASSKDAPNSKPAYERMRDGRLEGRRISFDLDWAIEIFRLCRIAYKLVLALTNTQARFKILSLANWVSDKELL